MEDKDIFLIESFNLIAETQSNPEHVYEFWRMNIDKIDASLIQIIPAIASQLLEAKGKEEREWIARMFFEFSNLIQHFPLGKRGINLELAIIGYQLCATIVTRYSSFWANLQFNLGTAYLNRIEGNRKENIEQAIHAYQAFLEVSTRQDFPVKWADTQYNLGIAYLNRIEGDHNENIEQAIRAYRAALEVFTLKSSPIQSVQWAMSQTNLGDAYRNRIEGNHNENIEQAIRAYRAALEVFSRQNFPVEWGIIQNNLNHVCRDQKAIFLQESLQLIENNQGKAGVYEFWQMNIDQIDASLIQIMPDIASQILEAEGKENRVPIARTFGEFGYLLQEFPLGNRKINLELAIAIFQVCANFVTLDESPNTWVLTQNNLGAAYVKRIAGDRRENIEQAIQFYQASMEPYGREGWPDHWARIQQGLGYAYRNRIEGNRKENIEQSIQCYRAALEVHTRESFPYEWVFTQNSLGVAYRSRIAGDRKENLEQSIQTFRVALEVTTRQNFPIEWAKTQTNLGNAYQNQIEEERKENIELAVRAYQASLEIYTRENFPENWASNQNNLGTAYRNRIEENIEQAIQAYQAALEVRTRKDFPIEWAETQTNLGIAYSIRIEGDRKANIEQAIQVYRAALEVRTRKDFPIEWAETQTNLGIAYSIRIEGDRKANIEQAIQALRSSLEVKQPELMPFDCLQTGSNLGNLAFNEGDWNTAIEGFEQAITAVEKSRSWAMSDRRRQEILDESIGIYEKMLQSCINADRLDLALQTVERVRSKRLVDLMAAPDLYPQGEIPEPVRLILDRITNTQQQMDDLRSVTPANAPELADLGWRDRAAVAPPTAEIQALEAQKQTLLDELSRYDAVSAQLLEISPPDVSQIQAELLDQPDVALLSFYTTSQDTHILIVRSNSIQCFTCPGQGFEQLQRWLINEWVLPYLNDRTSWEQTMPERLQQLADKLELDRLVAEHLQNARELILIPHLLLHLIPFAALPLTKNQHYLGDRFLLRYAPGCQVLKFCTDRNPLPPSQQYGTVENTTEDLPFSTIEAEAIAQLFQIKDIDRLRGSQQATIGAYKQLLDRVNSVASCHHAQSRLDNPLESALILANGMRVTLADLLSPAWRFADLSDVFLSCCETGMTMPQSFTDELLTLGTGFLCAGARSVISSLWAINDLATALLSQIYHQYRAQEQDRIVALQKAQQDLRRIPGDRLKYLSETEFIPALMVQQEQLEQCRQTARRQKQQTAPDSAAYRHCKSEERRYGELIDRLETANMALEILWQEAFPFNHPVYWAAFTCQGLR